MDGIPTKAPYGDPTAQKVLKVELYAKVRLRCSWHVVSNQDVHVTALGRLIPRERTKQGKFGHTESLHERRLVRSEYVEDFFSIHCSPPSSFLESSIPHDALPQHPPTYNPNPATALIQCTLTMTIPIIERAEAFTTRRAIVATEGAFTYGDLLAASERAASELLDGADDLADARVVFLVPGGFQYVAVQWAIWRAGGIAVPLALSETEREIRYKIDDTEPAVLIAHPNYARHAPTVLRRRRPAVHYDDQVARRRPKGPLA